MIKKSPVLPKPVNNLQVNVRGTKAKVPESMNLKCPSTPQLKKKQLLKGMKNQMKTSEIPLSPKNQII